MERPDPVDARYVPAARRHALTRLYDPIVAATMRERLWREARAGFGALRPIDGRVQTADHAAGRLPAIVATAGFGGVACDRRAQTAFGSLELLTATSTKEA